MKFKCYLVFVFGVLAVVVNSASIYSKPIDIPVKIVYDEQTEEAVQGILIGEILGRRNLNEKIQLSPTEIKQLSSEYKESENIYSNYDGVRNLDAKIQLSPEQLLQADKHLPFDNSLEESALLSSVRDKPLLESAQNDKPADEGKPAEEEKPAQEEKSEQEEKPAQELPSEKPLENSEGNQNLYEENQKPIPEEKPSESVFQALGETQPAVAASSPIPSSTTSVPTEEEDLTDPNLVLLIQIAQSIVNVGLNNIKENINNWSNSEQNSNKNPPISEQQWNRLNQTITDFFSTLLSYPSTKSNNQNVLQNIVFGVKSATDDFVENLRQNPQPQRPGQNLINFISTGFQQITGNLNNIPNQNTTSNAVSGESPATTESARPIQNLINRVQQFLGGQPESNSPQADSPAPATVAAPGGTQLVQNSENSVPQGVSTLNPGPADQLPGNVIEGAQNTANNAEQAISNSNSADPASTKADAPTTSRPAGPFQSAINQVGQVINNLNPFNPPSTAAPGAQNEGTTSGNNPFEVFQGAVSQVGQAINNFINQGSTQAPGSQNEEAPNPVRPFQETVQNVANQIGAAVGSLNPFNPPSTAAPGAQNEGESSTSGPFQQVAQNVQNVANQIGSAINNLNPFNSSPAPPSSGTQNEEQTTSAGPIQQAFQNVVNQVGSAINNLNPLNQGSTAAPGAQNEGTQNGPIQNVVNQISQAASNLNPFQSSTTSNPIQGAINQVAQAISSTPANPLQGSLQNLQTIGNQTQQLLQGAVGGGSQPSNPIQTIQGAVGGLTNPPGSSLFSSTLIPTANPIGIIQSVGSQITNPTAKIEGNAKREQETMVAMD